MSILSGLEFVNSGRRDVHEMRQARLKDAWEDEMTELKDKYIIHEKVSVLLLSWHPDVDDLKTDKEISDLHHIFQDTFHYTIRRAILTTGSDKSTQIQLNKHLSDFAFDHDGTDALLIVYYAGHARLGDEPGELYLTGSISLPNSDTQHQDVIWNTAENIIKDTQGDVLVIFDCCFAGDVDSSIKGRWDCRAFEFLAATSANSTIPKPGPRSFTAAMIHSLSTLVEQGSFSTQELVRQIRYAPNFPRYQYPKLYERRLSRRKIVLSPKKPGMLSKAIELQRSLAQCNTFGHTRQDLLVRYIFNNPITESMVREVARSIQRLIKEGALKAKAAALEEIITPANMPQDDARRGQTPIEHSNHTHSAPAAPSYNIIGTQAVQISSLELSSDHANHLATLPGNS